MSYRKRWVGPLDQLTCSLCTKMIGETTPLHMSFDGEIWSLPAHPDCRCRVVIEEVHDRTGKILRSFHQKDY